MVTASNREQQRQRFLEQQGLESIVLVPLTQDASFRQYFRLPGIHLLLMDAPPDVEKPEPFYRITGYLKQAGVRVPAIHGADLEQGFILLEDLGDATFTHLLLSGTPEPALYEKAVKTLLAMQQGYNPKTTMLPAYNLQTAVDEAVLFADWYLPARLERVLSQSERDTFTSYWVDAFENLEPLDPVLVHRDFHVDNLLMVDDQCAMLDYQDALLGSPVYDLVSLLEDARRDVNPELRQRLAELWRQQSGIGQKTFDSHYQFWGAQRHAKVAGIFVRLWLRDGKPGYLQHLNRVFQMLNHQLSAQSQKPLQRWLNQLLPERMHQPLNPDAGFLRGFTPGA